MQCFVMLVTICGVLAAPAAGQDGKKAPMEEWVPAPRPVSGQIMPYYIPNSLPIPGTREVWQYYGVDSTGRFRPLVVNSPLGAYYLYNGHPYPWTTTRPGSYMPYAVD
jgi:hypothetical protein